jgi:hypothetical protein
VAEAARLVQRRAPGHGCTQRRRGEDVVRADGYVWVTPENLAAMSGIMKDFFDRTYYAALDRIAGRPYATLVCAGSDGENAVRQIERISTGWRLKRIAEPIIVCTHAQTPEAILAPKTIGPEDLAVRKPRRWRRDGVKGILGFEFTGVIVIVTRQSTFVDAARDLLYFATSFFWKASYSCGELVTGATGLVEAVLDVGS